MLFRSSLSDLTANNGTLSNLSSATVNANGTVTYTATFTPNSNIEDTTNVVSLTTGYTDTVGNTGTTAESANYTIDTLAPTATITVNTVTSDNVINQSELAAGNVPVTGTVGGDVKVGDIVTLTINGHTYVGGVTANLAGELTYSIDVLASDLVADENVTASVATTDAAGNTTTVTANHAVGVDVVAPTIEITNEASGNATTSLAKVGDTITANFTSTDPVTSVTIGGHAAQLTLVNAVTGTYTATYVVASGDNAIATDVVVTSRDTAGNTTTQTLSGRVTVDTVAPTATITLSDDALRIGDTSTVTITFSEAVSGFSLSDLTANNGTLSNLSSATVNANGRSEEHTSELQSH